MSKLPCLIVAGEKSGEEHALSFVPELLDRLPGLELFGVGGNALEELGMQVLYHLNDFSTFGFSDVLGKIPFYASAMNKLCDEVVRRDCRTAILIDYQTFNLKLALRLKKLGVNVLYFVAPQAWAWKAWRTKPLSECVHTLFTILPFEKKWFQERGVREVIGVPHPLLKTYASELKCSELGIEAKPFEAVQSVPRILLLPGSRSSEVRYMLPAFDETIERLSHQFPYLEVGMVRSPSVAEDLFDCVSTPALSKLSLRQFDSLAQAMQWGHICLAASGTITLTAALFQLPTVVCYDASLLNRWVYETFVSYRGPISLANIVLLEGISPTSPFIFPELTKERVNGFEIERKLKPWLTDEREYERIKCALATTASKITGDRINLAEYMSQVIQQA